VHDNKYVFNAASYNGGRDWRGVDLLSERNPIIDEAACIPSVVVVGLYCRFDGIHANVNSFRPD